jgi:hypothetical protein
MVSTHTHARNSSYSQFENHLEFKLLGSMSLNKLIEKENPGIVAKIMNMGKI